MIECDRQIQDMVVGKMHSGIHAPWPLARSIEVAGLSAIIGFLTLQVEMCDADTLRVYTTVYVCEAASGESLSYHHCIVPNIFVFLKQQTKQVKMWQK